MNLCALSSRGIECSSLIFWRLLVNFGTEARVGRSVWVAASTLSGSSDTSDPPSDSSNPSASIAAGMEASVVAAAGGLSSPSDSSSERNFNTFSFRAGFCNISANSFRISLLLDAAALLNPTGGSFSDCLEFVAGGSFIFPVLDAAAGRGVVVVVVAADAEAEADADAADASFCNLLLFRSPLRFTPRPAPFLFLLGTVLGLLLGVLVGVLVGALLGSSERRSDCRIVRTSVGLSECRRAGTSESG